MCHFDCMAKKGISWHPLYAEVQKLSHQGLKEVCRHKDSYCKRVQGGEYFQDLFADMETSR